MEKCGIVSIPARQRIFDLILVILKFFWYVLLIHPEPREVGSSWKIVFLRGVNGVWPQNKLITGDKGRSFCFKFVELRSVEQL